MERAAAHAVRACPPTVQRPIPRDGNGPLARFSFVNPPSTLLEPTARGRVHPSCRARSPGHCAPRASVDLTARSENRDRWIRDRPSGGTKRHAWTRAALARLPIERLPAQGVDGAEAQNRHRVADRGIKDGRRHEPAARVGASGGAERHERGGRRADDQKHGQRMAPPAREPRELGNGIAGELHPVRVVGQGDVDGSAIRIAAPDARGLGEA